LETRNATHLQKVKLGRDMLSGMSEAEDRELFCTSQSHLCVLHKSNFDRLHHPIVWRTCYLGSVQPSLSPKLYLFSIQFIAIGY